MFLYRAYTSGARNEIRVFEATRTQHNSEQTRHAERAPPGAPLPAPASATLRLL